MFDRRRPFEALLLTRWSILAQDSENLYVWSRQRTRQWSADAEEQEAVIEQLDLES